MKDGRNTGYLVAAALAAAFLFGAATPASKALLQDVKPQALAGLLYIGGAIGVLPAMWRERAFHLPWRAGRRTALLLAGAVVFGGVLGPWLLLLGLRAARSGSVSLLLSLELAATVLLGRFLFREHLSGRSWLGAAGALAAAILLAVGEGQAGVVAALLVGAACLSWGFDNHFTALIDGISPSETTFWKGAVAGPFNLLIGGVLLRGVGSTSAALLALLVGGLAFGVSIALYISSAQGLGASRSQIAFSTAPFFGLVLSLMLLGEPLSWLQSAAAVLIAASLLVLFSERHAHTHWHDPVAHRHWHRHDDCHHDHEHADPVPSEVHLHAHEHGGVEHEHVHWPDIHHRHGHAEAESRGPSNSVCTRRAWLSRRLHSHASRQPSRSRLIRGPLAGEDDMKAKFVAGLKILVGLLVVLNVVGIVTGGCASSTVPAPLTPEQRGLVERERLDLVVGVQEYRAPVYSEKLVLALRDTEMFARVEHLEGLSESPDIVASVETGISGTAAIPLLPLVTAGIVPMTVEEGDGHVFSLRTPGATSDTVRVEFYYSGPTTLGLAALFLNLSPTRARGDASKNPQVRDAFAYEIAVRAPMIRELARQESGDIGDSPAN